MSKKLYIFLTLLIISICALVYVILPSETKDVRRSTADKVRTRGLGYSPPKIYFTPEFLTLTSTASAELTILIDSEIVAEIVQLEIGYDPNLIYDVSIIAGTYLQNPQLVLNKIDNKNGRISMAFTGSPNSNEVSNSLAILNFKVTPVWTTLQTSINLLPKTSLKDKNGNVKIKNLEEAKIIIDPAFYTPPASVSAIPNQL